MFGGNRVRGGGQAERQQAGSRPRYHDLLAGATLPSLYNTAPAKGGIERLRAHSRLGRPLKRQLKGFPLGEMD